MEGGDEHPGRDAIVGCHELPHPLEVVLVDVAAAQAAPVGGVGSADSRAQEAVGGKCVGKWGGLLDRRAGGRANAELARTRPPPWPARAPAPTLAPAGSS